MSKLNVMSSLLIKNALIVNEGDISEGDVFVRNGRITKIGKDLNLVTDRKIDAAGLHLIPGVIDDQVHFREPGLTHKAEIFTESAAAIAGGTTSFMEMPNTIPQTLTQQLLEEKYALGAANSLANYSFFMGASNENLKEVMRINPNNVCGIKVFMGSSTGNMLVDDETTLERIFREAPILIATHCEKEEIIRANLARYLDEWGNDIPVHFHPLIRSREACYASSSLAVQLAKKHDTRLHILHISTAEEIELFGNLLPLAEKRITSEVCIHHLWFSDTDYVDKGMKIKWNPAVKKASDRKALFDAMLDDRLDIIATDHAPHTLEEKNSEYSLAPSGGPLVQHALLAMLDFYKQRRISLEKIVEKMSHAPAICFQVKDRGYIREGYHADLVLIDLKGNTKVTKDNIHYKCGWSPFEGHTFPAEVTHTFINGELVYFRGSFDRSIRGQRLLFER